MKNIVKTGLYFLYTTASLFTASTIGLNLDPAPEYKCIPIGEGIECGDVPSWTAVYMAISTFSMLMMTGGAIYAMSPDSGHPDAKNSNTPGSSHSEDQNKGQYKIKNAVKVNLNNATFRPLRTASGVSEKEEAEVNALQNNLGLRCSSGS